MEGRGDLRRSPWRNLGEPRQEAAIADGTGGCHSGQEPRYSGITTRAVQGGGHLFERFTDRARRVLVLAQEEARLLNHNFIGTEHILLGLIHEGEGIAAKAL